MESVRKILLFAVFGLIIFYPSAFCEIVSETIEYKHGEAVLEGYLAYDEAVTERQPAVLVVHEWKGLGDYVKMRANKLAELGYVAFAIDMYGKGVRAATNEEASQLAGVYKNDRELMRSRAKAALDFISQDERVDPSKIAAIGYCFGGTVALEMARAGFPLAGVVSFHGGLASPLPADPGQIKSKVLILHGASDPYVPPAEVAQFQEEMRKTGADMRFVAYDGAVHGFTNPDSGNDPTKGIAYNKVADDESWDAMNKFLEEVFKG